MKALICGGREWSDYEFISYTLDEIHEQKKFTSIIHGNSLGADYLSGVWARNRKVPVVTFPADWNKYRTKAGPIRNQRMLDDGKPDLCIAFPGGRGTNDMIKRCQKNNVEVYIAGSYGT